LKERLGELTEDRKDQLDAEFWETKAKRMVAADLAINGRLSPTSLEFMSSLEPVIRQNVVAFSVSDPKYVHAWYMDQSDGVPFKDLPSLDKPLGKIISEFLGDDAKYLTMPSEGV
jgi:hypothetical protein